MLMGTEVTAMAGLNIFAIKTLMYLLADVNEA